MDWQIKLRVVVNARKTALVGLMDEGENWRIRLAAPPVEGKANSALVRWLARVLGLSQREVVLVAGERSRDKRLGIQGLNDAQVHDLLRKLVEG